MNYDHIAIAYCHAKERDSIGTNTRGRVLKRLLKPCVKGAYTSKEQLILLAKQLVPAFQIWAF